MLGRRQQSWCMSARLALGNVVREFQKQKLDSQERCWLSVHLASVSTFRGAFLDILNIPRAGSARQADLESLNAFVFWACAKMMSSTWTEMELTAQSYCWSTHCWERMDCMLGVGWGAERWQDSPGEICKNPTWSIKLKSQERQGRESRIGSWWLQPLLLHSTLAQPANPCLGAPPNHPCFHLTNSSGWSAACC